MAPQRIEKKKGKEKVQLSYYLKYSGMTYSMCFKLAPAFLYHDTISSSP